jgi:hypothetical protein
VARRSLSSAKFVIGACESCLRKRTTLYGVLFFFLFHSWLEFPPCFGGSPIATIRSEGGYTYTIHLVYFSVVGCSRNRTHLGVMRCSCRALESSRLSNLPFSRLRPFSLPRPRIPTLATPASFFFFFQSTLSAFVLNCRCHVTRVLGGWLV